MPAFSIYFHPTFLTNNTLNPKYMSKFLDLAASRHSVRSYTPQPIEAEKLDYVLECARLAPSAVNHQPWRLYLITPQSSPKMVNAIRQCYDRPWFATASHYLIITIRHDESWHRGSDGKDHGDIDVAILSEHICLAATEMGLGSCWVCNFDAALCRNLFSFGADEEPAVFIPLGYAADDDKPHDKIRRPLSEILTRL